MLDVRCWMLVGFAGAGSYAPRSLNVIGLYTIPTDHRSDYHSGHDHYGIVFAAGLAIRFRGTAATSDFPRLVENAAGRERRENARLRPGKNRPAGRLCFRGQPSQPDGHAGGTGAHSTPIPVFGEKRFVLNPNFGDTFAQGRASAGGKGRPPGVAAQHE